MLSPRFNPSSPPAFYEMEPLAFQYMCCDLFAAEPGIANCEVYGTPGQLQQGIDLLAYCDDGIHTEVGQCKCYKDFQPREIRAASDEFFKYLDYWLAKKVRKFILFVAGSSAHLKAFVESAINTLIDKPLAREKWLLIIALVGDLPIYSDLVEKLSNLIINLDFTELYRSEPSTALFALMLACDHAANFVNEDLRAKLEKELVAIAELITTQEQTKQVDDEISDLVLECVLKLTVKANDPRSTSRSLNNLFEKISRAWSRFAGRRANGLSRNVQELPINQLHGAWITNLLVRALRENQ